MNAAQEFGAQLKRYRTRAGMPMRVLAIAAKIKVPNISMLENAKTSIGPALASRLADALSLRDLERWLFLDLASKATRNPHFRGDVIATTYMDHVRTALKGMGAGRIVTVFAYKPTVSPTKLSFTPDLVMVDEHGNKFAVETKVQKLK